MKRLLLKNILFYPPGRLSQNGEITPFQKKFFHTSGFNSKYVHCTMHILAQRLLGEGSPHLCTMCSLFFIVPFLYS